MSAELVGTYVGEVKARPGREAELDAKDRARIRKNKERLDLEIRSDGTFSCHPARSGTWRRTGNLVKFSVLSFDGKTLEEMREQFESQGAAFRLGFLFDPFELALVGDALQSTDEASPLMTEYLRE
jgi:hypothetical protein